MRPVAADMMLVLGDIGEMREVGEGANDRQRLVGAERVERGFQLAPGGRLVVAVEADRGLTDLLDEREGLLALLLAHRVAEDAAEQADVLAQGAILVGVAVVFDGELLGEGHGSASVGRRARMVHCGAAQSNCRTIPRRRRQPQVPGWRSRPLCKNISDAMNSAA